jgi:diamine N-acetyltransferase
MALLANEVIYLRALEPEDLDILYKWENDSEHWNYGSTLTPYSKFTLRDYLSNSAQDFLQTRQLRLIIVEKENNSAIGTIDLYDFDPMNSKAGVGILLDAPFRNKGYGVQALHLMEEYAFRFLLLKQLYAFVPKNNSPSFKLFERSGYETSGLLRSWLKTSAGFEDVYLMQLLLNPA